MKKAKKVKSASPRAGARSASPRRPAYSRDILPAPASLVEAGRFNLGTFGDAIGEVNALDAERPYPLPLPGLLKSFRLKEWEALQLGDGRFFLLVVVYNAKSFGLVQFVCYDRMKNEKLLYEKIVPCTSLRVARGLFGTRTAYVSDGFRIEITNRLNAGLIGVDISIRDHGDLPEVQASFLALHRKGKVAPLVVCQPLAARRAMYSHKCLMPMEGEMSIGEMRHEFDERASFAIVDDHKGYYPYNLRYDWVTGASRNGKGGIAGFNLTRNQVLDPERYNENCLWCDGELTPLPPVEFTRPGGPGGEWSVRDTHGMVDLTFTPVAQGEIRMNLLAVKVDYYGPFGSFRGAIVDRKGRKVSVDGFFGMGEQKFLRA